LNKEEARTEALPIAQKYLRHEEQKQLRNTGREDAYLEQRHLKAHTFRNNYGLLQRGEVIKEQSEGGHKSLNGEKNACVCYQSTKKKKKPKESDIVLLRAVL
jgi:hypothetical protein